MLCAALLSADAAAAVEADSRLEIQAALGFSGTFRLGYWTPLSVTVSNHGEHLSGELQVRLTYRDTLQDQSFTKTHRRTLSLSRNSRKRVRFTVFVESFADPLDIRVVAGSRELARHSVALRHRFTEAGLVLVVSRDANLDYLNDRSGRVLRVLYPHPDLLPDRWQGYDGVSAVVVHGMSLENLSRRQFDALKKWLAQGGRLAVSGGPDYSLLRTPRLAELLPAAPDGLLRIEDAAAVGQAFDSPLAAAAPFHLHRLSANSGHVLYRVGDNPLVVERATGRGSIVYLSFDLASPPFDSWPGTRRVLAEVLQLPLQQNSFSRRQLRRASLVPAALEQPAGKLQGHGPMLVFSALYLGVLATVYRLQPRPRYRRLLPAVILACPVVFTVAAYCLFARLLYESDASVIVASVIEPFPSGPYAGLRMDVGLFARRQRPLRVEFDTVEPGFIASHREPRWGVPASYSVYERTPQSLNIPYGGPYELHMLQADDVILYDVKVNGARTERGVQLFIHNHTGLSWSDTWLVSRHKIYRLGAVGHDDGSRITLAAEHAQRTFDGESWRLALAGLTESERRSTRLAGTLLESAIESAVRDLSPAEALLVAIVPSPVRLASANADWQQELPSVVLFRLRVTPLVEDNVAG